MKFEKFNISVFSSIYYDGLNYYTMALTTHSPEYEIHDHYSLFLKRMRHHFISNKMPFEIRVNTGDFDFQQLINDNIDQADWRQENISGEISWHIKL